MTLTIDYTGTETFLKEATNVIFSHKEEFDLYVSSKTYWC